jgi:hypothetical protein
VQIFYGKSYISNVANRFIDDEYDKHENSSLITNYQYKSAFPLTSYP